MEHYNNRSFRNSSSKIKGISKSHEKALIRKQLQESKQKPYINSSTPCPSLTLRLMDIFNRPQKDMLKNDKIHNSDKYTSNKLEELIKNNAVTFISPNDLINQLDTTLNSPGSKEKLNLKYLRYSSSKKITKVYDRSSYRYFPSSYLKDAKYLNNMLLADDKQKIKSKINAKNKESSSKINSKMLVDKSKEFHQIFDTNKLLNSSIEIKRKTNSSIRFLTKKVYNSKSAREVNTVLLRSFQIHSIPC